MQTAYLHAIYCDDIRQEVGGKVTLVGCYNAYMYVKEFPILIPKIGISVVLATPADRVPKTMAVKVFHNETELAEAQIEISKLEVDETLPDEGRWLTFSPTFILQTLAIEASGNLRVRGFIDEDELKGPALRIETFPAGAATPEP